ncbi:MAG: NUDIX hydrolase [Calditrichaeota bacterium]|nr:MAG: NUDIX hydrolase [Calditrichota bacterium]
MNQHPQIAVRAIIENRKGAVLVLKRANTSSGDGLWCLPGGKVDYGQTLAQAIEREVAEETQLSCRNPRCLFFHESVPTSTPATHYITFYFFCQVDQEPMLNFESSDFAWITPQQLQDFQFAFLNDVALRRYWTDAR